MPDFKPYVWLCFAVLFFYVALHLYCCSGAQADDPADCDAACHNLWALGCDAGAGSPGADDAWGTVDDLPCTEVCVGVVENGGQLQLECTIDAQSCLEVDGCFD